MSGRYTWVVCLALLVVAPVGVPSAGAEQATANVQFEAQVPAPTVALAGSADGRHVLAVDEESRFTFIPDMGADEFTWRAPKTGALATIDPAMGEVPPIPIGVGVTPDGDYWAGAVAYEDKYGGRLWSFARWSDQPIWSYDLSDGSGQADQPTVVDAGGRFVVMGTERGKLYVFEAADDGEAQKRAYRVYDEDNRGNDFTRIADVDVSRDGKRFLIGTAQSGKGSLHLYSDVFFMFSFTRLTDGVQDVAISADGTRGAAVTGSGATSRLHFLDLTTGRTIWETSIGASATGLGLSKDGGTLAVGTTDGRVLVYQARGLPNDRDPIQEHRFVDAIDDLAVADDGYAIAVGTAGGKLHFLDRDRPAPLWTYDTGSPVVGTVLGSDAEVLALSARTDDDARVIYTAAEHTIEQIAPPQPRLAPGVVNSVPIEVANNGNRMERVRIEWGALPEGWEGLDTNITLAPGESGSFSAKLSVKKGQAPGTFPLSLTIASGPTKIPLALTAVVPEMASGRTTERWAFPVAVPGGAPAAFILQLENTGNTRNTATLGYAKLPSGWEARFAGPSEYPLKPGEDREVVLKVWAPKGTPVGREAWFDVVVAWSHGEERVPMTIRLVDAADYRELLALEGDDDPTTATVTQGLEDERLSSTEVGSKESKDTPGFGIVALLGAVGAVVAVRRRRA